MKLPISRHLGILTTLSLFLWAVGLLSSVQAADYTYTTNNGTVTITRYIGPGGAVTIPDQIGGLPVTSIGWEAFWDTSLTSVTIPNSVTIIGDRAFAYCTSLTGVFFDGNAPEAYCFWVGPVMWQDHYVCPFDGDTNATVYYLPGTTGWGTTLGGRPTAVWQPQVATGDPTFGVMTNQFGFNVTWASGRSVVVGSSTTLTNPTWSPVATNTLTGGTDYFSDPQWGTTPVRFYRVRSP